MRTVLAILALCFVSLSVLSEEQTIISHAIAERGTPLYDADFKHWNYVNPDAPIKGYITQGTRGTYDNFNRYAQRGTSAAGINGYLYDSLMVGNSDEEGVLYGLIAEKIEYPASYEWVIFHLNPNARFQDDVPIRASDVAFSFNLFMTDGVPQFRRYYEGVSVEILDPLKVKYTLPKDGAEKSMIAQLAGSVVFPEHFYKDKKLSEPFDTPPLGSGGYKVSDYSMGQFVEYELQDNYWALKHPTIIGSTNFKHIRYDYYLDDTVLLEAFKKGEYDIRQESVSKNWATQYTGKNFKNGHIIKEEVTHEIPQPMQSFVFNLQKDQFKDRRVRKALILLFDFEWSNKNLFYDAYTRTYSYFQNTEFMATGLPTGKELEILNKFKGKIPDEVFTEEYQSFETDGSGNIRSQIRQALALFKEAGYYLKDGLMLNKETDQPYEFEMLLYSPNFERVALPYKENLAKAGITMNVRTVDPTQYINRLRERDHDVVVDSLGGGSYPSESLVFEWQTEYIDSTYNRVGPMDPIIDELVQGIADNQQNDEMLMAYGKAFDRVLLWNYYVIPQWHKSSFWIAYWDKFGRPDVRPKFALGTDSWWLDEKAAAKLPDRNAR